MWSTNGEEDGGEEAVIGGVDERLPEQNCGSVSSRGQRGSSRYSRLAWRLTRDDG
jgi:hypothetical protein